MSLLGLSIHKKVRAKEAGKEKTGEMALHLSFFSFPWSIALLHQSCVSLAFRADLCAKNESPAEETMVG